MVSQQLVQAEWATLGALLDAIVRSLKPAGFKSAATAYTVSMPSIPARPFVPTPLPPPFHPPLRTALRVIRAFARRG